MKEITTKEVIKYLTFIMIVIFSFFPILVSFPFNINIFLAWEGAYRISLGQIPYKDFFLPMGFVFWILPGLFFKIFGAKLFTLIIYQCFVNLTTFLSFRYILIKLRVNSHLIFLSLIVLELSYVILNFWPWYNNFVFVLQLVSLVLFFASRSSKTQMSRRLFIVGTAGFSVLAFFTKQDAGALTIMLNFALVLFAGIKDNNFKQLIVYVVSVALWSLLFVLPFLNYNIQYWFNVGQPPHFSRLDLFTYLEQLFHYSIWIKFYLLAIAIIIIVKYRDLTSLISSEKNGLFLILTIGILFQASLVQVTSYIPHYTHLYFHSFAFAFIMSQLDLDIITRKLKYFIPLILLTIFLWSGDSWKYGLRLVKAVLPESQVTTATNVVDKNSWLKTAAVSYDDKSTWQLSSFKAFQGIKLPPETLLGMERLKERYTGITNLKVLNMSELTPLAYELGFEPLLDHPLWYHKNVSIFDEDIALICARIRNHEYDVVIFESIPILNNFYPDEILVCLKQNYLKIDEFRAPRREIDARISVFEP